MKLRSLLVFGILILPSLAVDKECLITPIKEFEVTSPSQSFSMSIFISSTEKLSLQIAFEGFQPGRDSDHLEISTAECVVHRKRNRALKTEQLNCSDIVQGWQQANISITSNLIDIGQFLNHTLDHPISYMVVSASQSSYCQENLPSWEITDTEKKSIKIPLKGQVDVNLILESDEQFSPILHILGNSLSLSWKKDTLAISEGPPLPEGQYLISIFNITNQIILKVYSINWESEVSVTNLGDFVDELSISSKKGTFYSILDLSRLKEVTQNATTGAAEVPNNGVNSSEKWEAPRKGNSCDTTLRVITSLAVCVALVSIIVCVYIVKRNNRPLQNKNIDFEQQPMIPVGEVDQNVDKRTKVDIKGVIENFSQLTEPNNDILRKYKLKMEKDHIDTEKKVQKLSLGSLDPCVPTKTILILGETGSGKSSAINAIVNYIFGIEIEDKERFILVENHTESKKYQSESQTEFMTAYVIPYQYGMPNNCNYILIDTPGFGDTRGFERDQQIMIQLENFLKQDYGITQVDVFGLVVKSSAPRYTISQRYIYDGLFSMFGKDISHNIFLLVTFSGEEDPPVLEVLRNADIKFHDNIYFKLNTDSLYSTYKKVNDTDEYSFENPDRIIVNWEMTEKSLQKLFKMIMTLNPVSLSLTKVVLEANTRLHVVAEDLQKQIKEGLDKLTQLKANQLESSEPEKTKLIELDTSHTEELLVNSIREAQQLTTRLKEIPLRLDPLSVHGYIEKIIDNEQKEMKPNYEGRIKILKKLKEENSVLKAILNKEQSPGESWLHYFQKLKEE